MACAKPDTEGDIYISSAGRPFYHASIMLLLIISAAVSPFLIQRWDMRSLTCANIFYVLLLINQTEWSTIPACPLLSLLF